MGISNRLMAGLSRMSFFTFCLARSSAPEPGRPVCETLPATLKELWRYERMPEGAAEQRDRASRPRRRKAVLLEQMATIQRELGEGDGKGQEVAELAEAIAKANMPEEAESQALDEEHYGLEKIKSGSSSIWQSGSSRPRARRPSSALRGLPADAPCLRDVDLGFWQQAPRHLGQPVEVATRHAGSSERRLSVSPSRALWHVRSCASVSEVSTTRRRVAAYGRAA